MSRGTYIIGQTSAKDADQRGFCDGSRRMAKAEVAEARREIALGWVVVERFKRDDRQAKHSLLGLCPKPSTKGTLLLKVDSAEMMVTIKIPVLSFDLIPTSPHRFYFLRFHCSVSVLAKSLRDSFLDSPFVIDV